MPVRVWIENRGGGGANNGPGNLYSSQRHPVPTAASRVAYHACIRVIFGSWPVASLVTKLWRRFVPRRLTLDNRGTNSLIHSPSCVHDSIISPRMICELNGNRTVYVVYFSFFFFFCDSSSSENMMDVFLWEIKLEIFILLFWRKFGFWKDTGYAQE